MIPASSAMAFAKKNRVAMLDIEHPVPAELRTLSNPQTALTEPGFMDSATAEIKAIHRVVRCRRFQETLRLRIGPSEFVHQSLLSLG